jgi:hypothetical protein
MDMRGMSSKRFSVRSSLYRHHLVTSMEPAGMEGAMGGKPPRDWGRSVMILVSVLEVMYLCRDVKKVLVGGMI